MFLFHSIPETQLAMALSILLATFIYEDGATVLAATLSTGGGLDPRIGLLTVFLGIWLGDMGLYGLGASFGRRVTNFHWLQKQLGPASLAKAESWFARYGSRALVISRAVPGSRLPLYLAAGALRLPVRLFAGTTAACSAVWVSAIFGIWRFLPGATSRHHALLSWLTMAMVLVVPWLVGTTAVRVFHRVRAMRNCEGRASRCALGPCVL